MTYSIRNRLVLAIAVAASVVLIISGLVLDSLVRRALSGEFESNLLADAQSLTSLVKTRDRLLESDMSETPMPRFTRSNRPDYYGIWQDGKPIDSSIELSHSQIVPSEADGIKRVPMPDGRAGRAVSVSFVPVTDEDEDEDDETNDGTPTIHYSGGTITLVLARDTEDLDGSVSSLSWLILLVFGSAVVVLLVVSEPIVRIGLRPLRTTADQIQQLNEGSLESRMDNDHAPTEIKPLIDCLNDLFIRLDEAFKRERAFSANVAHELRTPLTGLRCSIEVALAKPREAAEYKNVLRRCLAICGETQEVIENLLTLGRIDAGQCPVDREIVNVSELLLEAWQHFDHRADEVGVQVKWNRATDDSAVETDREKLRLVLHNLLDNAISHSRGDRCIAIEDKSRGGELDITIRNTADPIPDADLDRIWHRFWRGDQSRQAVGKHAGLGLPLCLELARLMGHRLDLCGSNGEFAVQLHSGNLS